MDQRFKRSCSNFFNKKPGRKAGLWMHRSENGSGRLVLLIIGIDVVGFVSVAFGLGRFKRLAAAR